MCSTLLRLIRHFSWLGTFYGRLLWHFFGACIFLVGCLCTLGQKLAGKVYVGNSQSPVNDKNSVRTSGLGPWLVQPIISDSVSPSSFDKDDAVSRTEEGFYLLTAAVVDNTICRGLAQFDTKYQIYLYFYEVVFLVWNVFQPWECNLYSQLKNILKTFWHSSCNPGFHFLLPFHAQLMTPFVWQRW